MCLSCGSNRNLQGIIFLGEGEKFGVDLTEQPDFPFLGETLSSVRQERMFPIIDDYIILFGDPNCMINVEN